MSKERLIFSNVVVFGLDEYHGLPNDSPQSHQQWLKDHFLSKINILPENVHFLDSQSHLSDVDLHCRRYDEAIHHAGGFDLVILGIGRNGHIGFNEPFSIRKSRSRLCTLDPITRMSVASDFFGEESVPMQGLTVGLGTIWRHGVY